MSTTYIYIYIVPDVPDTSGECKNHIGPPKKMMDIDIGPIMLGDKKGIIE